MPLVSGVYVTTPRRASHSNSAVQRSPMSLGTVTSAAHVFLKMNFTLYFTTILQLICKEFNIKNSVEYFFHLSCTFHLYISTENIPDTYVLYMQLCNKGMHMCTCNKCMHTILFCLPIVVRSVKLAYLDLP